MAQAASLPEGLGEQLRALTANTASFAMYASHVVTSFPRTGEAPSINPADEMDQPNPLTGPLPPHEEDYLEPCIFDAMIGSLRETRNRTVRVCLAQLAGSNVVYLDEARDKRRSFWWGE